MEQKHIDMANGIAQVLRDRPDRFDMSDWFTPESAFDEFDVDINEMELEECGTVCCIAGWAINLELQELMGRSPTFNEVEKYLADRAESYERAGLRLLGIDSEKLFYQGEWPTWAYQRTKYMPKHKVAAFVARLLELLVKYEDLAEAWEELRFQLEVEDQAVDVEENEGLTGP
jgi:hypothetical protein